MRSVPKKYAIREEVFRRFAFCKKSLCLVVLLGLVSAAAFVATPESSITTMAQERTPKNVSPPLVKSPAEQPIPFSHKLHLTFDMKCQECHPNPEPGDRMTLPAADRCMECHRTVVDLVADEPERRPDIVGAAADEAEYMGVLRLRLVDS